MREHILLGKWERDEATGKLCYRYRLVDVSEAAPSFVELLHQRSITTLQNDCTGKY
jgi:hypothetical protein